MPIKTNKTPSLWDAFMSKFRDVVFVVLFFATATGWIVTSTNKKNNTNNKIEVLTEKVNDLTKMVEKQGDILAEQYILNGRIIQYMQQQ